MKNEKDEIIPSAKTPRPLKAFRKLTTTIRDHKPYNIDSIYLSHHRISQPQYPLGIRLTIHSWAFDICYYRTEQLRNYPNSTFRCNWISFWFAAKQWANLLILEWDWQISYEECFKAESHRLNTTSYWIRKLFTFGMCMKR